MSAPYVGPQPVRPQVDPGDENYNQAMMDYSAKLQAYMLEVQTAQGIMNTEFAIATNTQKNNEDAVRQIVQNLK
jgi:hypothetical protein